MRSHRLALTATFKVSKDRDFSCCDYGTFADLAGPGPELRSVSRNPLALHPHKPVENHPSRQNTTRGRR